MSGPVYEDLHVLIQSEKEVVLSFLLDGTLHSLSREASELMSKALTRLSSTLRKKTKKSRQSPSRKKKTLVKKEKDGMDLPLNSEGIEDEVHQSYQLSFESQPLNASLLTNKEYKTGMVLIIFPFHYPG